ncbi:hypothetical protein CVF41_20925 [Salmonella enterica]|nr:hypothetical protein [Salmonella enterica]
MFKYSFITASILFSFNNAHGGENHLAMIKPTRISQELTLINGDNLLNSRYANIVKPTAENINIIFNGVNESFIPAHVSLDSVKFSDDKLFKDFLENSGLADEYIDELIEQNNLSGFGHSYECKGARSDCIINTDGIAFVIDYYNKKVRMFASPRILKNNSNETSYLTLNGGLGIVNNISGYYFNSFSEINPSYYLREQGAIGYQSGTINYNFYYSDYYKNIDDLNLNYAFPYGNKISIGKSQNNAQFNSSSMQSIISDISTNGLRLGNSEELIDHSYDKKVISYYSPSSGTVEIIKNSEVVYAVATSPGYNELNLSNLPYGQYNAILNVKSVSGDIISTQNININNTQSFSTNKGWHVFLGESSSEQNFLTQKPKKIIELGFQFPLNFFSAGYIGGVVIDNDTIINTGLTFRKDNVSLAAKTGFGTHGFRYYEINSYIDSLSVSYKKVSQEKGWGDSEKETDNKILSINYNISITDGLSTNLGYMNSSSRLEYKESYNDTFDFKDGRITPSTKNRYSSENIYSNVFYNFNNGVSLFANMNKELDNNGYNLIFGISIPLSEKTRINNNSTYTTDKKLINNSSIDYTNKISENWSNTISSGTSISDTKYNSAMYNLSNNGSYMRGSGYIYATDDGYKSASLSLDSTQVISRDGLFFTSSPWYNSGYITRAKDAEYDIAVKNLTDNTTRYYGKNNKVISIPVYNKILLTSDLRSYDSIFSDKSSIASNIITVTPGSSFSLHKKIINTRSVIVTLKNASDVYASSAECESDNCIDISRLSKGVFRVKYTGENFVLQSNSEHCKSGIKIKDEFIKITCSK